MPEKEGIWKRRVRKVMLVSESGVLEIPSSFDLIIWSKFDSASSISGSNAIRFSCGTLITVGWLDISEIFIGHPHSNPTFSCGRMEEAVKNSWYPEVTCRMDYAGVETRFQCNKGNISVFVVSQELIQGLTPIHKYATQPSTSLLQGSNNINRVSQPCMA